MSWELPTGAELRRQFLSIIEDTTYNETEKYVTWCDYLTFHDNDYMKNQDGNGKGKYGAITLQPEFAYKNAKVTVKAPEVGDMNAGYLKISGTPYDLQGNKSIVLEDTYHLGDILKVETVMYDDYRDEYVPTGFRIRYKQTRSDKFVDDEYLYGADGFREICNGYLRYEEIEITPTFQRKENRILVRVAEEDISKFDTGFRVFLTPEKAETVLNGKKYIDYTFADTGKTVFGRQYAIPVKTRYASYRAVWQENGDDVKYTGAPFYYTAKDSPTKNIIYLTAEQPNGDPYFALDGSLYYMSYNLKTGAAGTAAAMPAENVAVSAPGGSAMVDKEGYFRTSRFPGIAGYSIRYMVSVNSRDEIRTAVLHTKQPETAGGLTTYVNTIEQTLDSQVSPINSEMFKQGNIRLQSSNEMGGQVIPITNDFAYMTISVGVTRYDQVRFDENGKREEIPNQKETPVKAELVIYNSKNEVVGKPIEAKKSDLSSDNNIIFDASINFGQNENGSTFAGGPGDRIFLRLTTDRGREFYGDDTQDIAYTYTDVFTGYVFTTDNTYEMPVEYDVQFPLNVS